MDPAAIFIILLIIGVIVIIIWFAINLRNRRIQQIQILQESGEGGAPAAGAGQQQTGWGDPQPVPGERGMCALYTFPAVAPGQPAIPTMNTQALDSMTPTEIGDVNCVDADQLALQKVNQTCVGNSVNGNICYGTEATVYQAGQNRQYYVQCNTTKCQDTLALVALNFNPTDFTMPPPEKSACLQFVSADASQHITGEICDLQNTNQILRIEREGPDGMASDSGVYGRLVDRSTGLCVVPSVVPPVTGTTLQLGSCSPSDGYVWWFFPPTTVTTQRTVDGVMIPVTTVAPQQLVYYPNNGMSPPKGADLTTYIMNNNPLAITVDVNLDGTMTATFGNTIYGQPVTLQPLSTDQRTNASQNEYGLASNAQTLDYWLYQTITETPVSCLTCGTNFTF